MKLIDFKIAFVKKISAEQRNDQYYCLVQIMWPNLAKISR